MRLLTVGLDESFRFDHPTDKAEDDEDALSCLALYEYDCCLANMLKVGEIFPHRMRERSLTTPLIMLIPKNFNKVELKVELLSRGADRVLEIPIDRNLLDAYIRALVRRYNGQYSDIITFGDIAIDVRNCELSLKGENVHVTPTEFDILSMLASHPTRVCSKESILHHVYNGLDTPDDKIVDVFICKIRARFKKLLPYNIIDTVWGRGYRMHVPTAEEVERRT